MNNSLITLMFVLMMAMTVSASSTVFGLFTKDCYEGLVNDATFSVGCISFTLSKVLGYVIILGALALKVPQILSILNAQSSEGMILSALYAEIISYASTASYNIMVGTPLSTYAETLIILVQNFIIVVLCWKYMKTSLVECIVFLSSLMVFVAVIPSVPSSYLSFLMVLATLTSVSGRIQQIYGNFAQKTTGVLSLTTTLLQVGGSAARVFTTMNEVDDVAILASFVIALVLNGILLLQIFLYWSPENDIKAEIAGLKKEAEAFYAEMEATSLKKKSKKAD